MAPASSQCQSPDTRQNEPPSSSSCSLKGHGAKTSCPALPRLLLDLVDPQQGRGESRAIAYVSVWELLCCHNRRRRWHPTPVLLPGKSHGPRSLVGCSPLDLEELDTTERLHFHFSLSYIGEGNGNPLQCSCLENPRDGAA